MLAVTVDATSVTPLDWNRFTVTPPMPVAPSSANPLLLRSWNTRSPIVACRYEPASMVVLTAPEASANEAVVPEVAPWGVGSESETAAPTFGWVRMYEPATGARLNVTRYVPGRSPVNW